MKLERIVSTTLLLALSVSGVRCAQQDTRPKIGTPAPVIDEPNAKLAADRTAKPVIIPGPDGIEVSLAKAEVLAALEVVGIPYAEMGVAIGRLERLLEAQGVKPTGFSRAIYLDDPALVEPSGYRYRVAFPVDAEAGLKAPVERIEMPARGYARVTHRGDFDESYQVRCFERIPRSIDGMGFDIDGPIQEIYRFTDLDSDASKWVTEVRYPVRKSARKKSAREKRAAKTDRAEGPSKKGDN